MAVWAGVLGLLDCFLHMMVLVSLKWYSEFCFAKPSPLFVILFLLAEPSWQFLPSASAAFTRDQFYRRGLGTQVEPTNYANEDEEKCEAGSLNLNSDSADDVSQVKSDDNSAVKYTAMSNLKTSSRHDLAMIFTCKVCETRSVKTACRESYERGVVVVRCDGCSNLHLIADRLGWFGEPGSIEDFLDARGEEVKKGSADTLNLTLEDLAGMKP
ncbi:DNL-type zinc finger protein [Vitis vinifera]|uniref:DNL-type zinc finger protein n=1 Tax=Vitis vinifera TaxID=29760 RepID=A0A438CWH6_VITVI|nr:DNL-type zinc finger protein [Vitis vinifera]RVW74154.1 DNL-type zinc finger protein [Vitis vinifera]